MPGLAAAQADPLVATSSSQPAVAPESSPTPSPVQPTPPPLVPVSTPSFYERGQSLSVLRISMATGGGSSVLFEDGYSARAGVFLGHARFRLGAVMGESLGPTLTIEAGGALQEPSETALCVTAPCEDAAPGDAARRYSLVAARVGYEGRNAAIDVGIGHFTCPGCLGSRGEELGSSFLPSFSGRVGPPLIHAWGEFAAGPVSTIREQEGGTLMIPAAFGVGMRLRPVYLRVGVASQGFVGDVDVAVFDDIHVGLMVWGFEDQFAGAIRITVPLGFGYPTGSAYRGRQ